MFRLKTCLLEDELNEPVCCRAHNVRHRYLNENRTPIGPTPRPIGDFTETQLREGDRRISGYSAAISRGALERSERDAAGRGDSFYTRDENGRIRLHLPIAQIFSRIRNADHESMQKEIDAYKEAFSAIWEASMTNADKTGIGDLISAKMENTVLRVHLQTERGRSELTNALWGCRYEAMRIFFESRFQRMAIELAEARANRDTPREVVVMTGIVSMCIGFTAGAGLITAVRLGVV